MGTMSVIRNVLDSETDDAPNKFVSQAPTSKFRTFLGDAKFNIPLWNLVSSNKIMKKCALYAQKVKKVVKISK